MYQSYTENENETHTHTPKNTHQKHILQGSENNAGRECDKRIRHLSLPM